MVETLADFNSLFAEAIPTPATRHRALSEGEETTTYRDLMDELIEMPRIRNPLILIQSLPYLDSLQSVQPLRDGCLACLPERLTR